MTPASTKKRTNTTPKQFEPTNITMSDEDSNDGGEFEIGDIQFDVGKVKQIFDEKKGGGLGLLNDIQTYFEGAENKTAKLLEMVLVKTEENNRKLDWLADQERLRDFLYKELRGVIVREKDIYFFASLVGRFKQTVIMLLQMVTADTDSKTGQGLMDNIATMILFTGFAIIKGYDNKETEETMTTPLGNTRKDRDQKPKVKAERTPHCGWPFQRGKNKHIYLGLLVAGNGSYLTKTSGERITIPADEMEKIRCNNMGKGQREDVAGPLVVLEILLFEALVRTVGRKWYGLASSKNGVAKSVPSLSEIMTTKSIEGYNQYFAGKKMKKGVICDCPMPAKENKRGRRFLPEVYFHASIFCMKGKTVFNRSKTNKKATVAREADEPEPTGWEEALETWLASDEFKEKMAEGTVARKNFDRSLETAIFKESQYDVLLGLVEGQDARYVDFNPLESLLSEPGDNDEIPDCNLRPPPETGEENVAVAPPELQAQLRATAPERQNPGATSGNPADVVPTEEGDNDGAPPEKRARKSRNQNPNYGGRR